jgi:hypothetical protein
MSALIRRKAFLYIMRYDIVLWLNEHASPLAFIL